MAQRKTQNIIFLKKKKKKKKNCLTQLYAALISVKN